jgi:hypothetical protein
VCQTNYEAGRHAARPRAGRVDRPD